MVNVFLAPVSSKVFTCVLTFLLIYTWYIMFCKVFNDEEIKDLVNTITTFAELGFGMTSRDIRELVHSYVEHNDHERGKKNFPLS